MSAPPTVADQPKLARNVAPHVTRAAAPGPIAEAGPPSRPLAASANGGACLGLSDGEAGAEGSEGERWLRRREALPSLQPLPAEETRP